MIASLTSRNHQDFRARFLGSFGYITLSDGKKKLVKVTNVSEDQVTFKAGDLFDYYAKVDSNFRFEFIPVTRGWYNTTDGKCRLLTRLPHRQWHRGIHSDNTGIFDIFERNYPVDYDNLSKIFVPGFNNWEYNKEQSECAISKFFAVTKSRVYFLNRSIGTIKNDLITLVDNTVKQELMDTIKRNNIPIKVDNA